MNVFCVSIRTTENYEFDMIRIAGVRHNATNYENSQGGNAIYVQPEMKFRSPPSHFHHELPLVAIHDIANIMKRLS